MGLVSRVIRSSPERVWSALTDPGELRVWYPPGFTEFEARVGGTFRADRTERGDLASHGVILELEPPRRLAYTVRSRHEFGSAEVRVAYTLEAHPRGSRVLVEESGFDDILKLAIDTPMRKLSEQLGRDVWRKYLKDEGRTRAAMARKLLRLSRAHWRGKLADLKSYCERG